VTPLDPVPVEGEGLARRPNAVLSCGEGPDDAAVAAAPARVSRAARGEPLS